MRKIVVLLVAFAVLLGLGVSPAQAVVTQPPIQGTHTVTHVGFGPCGTNRSLVMTFTVTGNQFQMDKVVYHGPAMASSPYILLDAWRGVTGAGAGSGSATRVFPSNVQDGETATRTSNWTNGDWLPKTLETAPINNPNNPYNFLDSHFVIGSGCTLKTNLASYASYPGELQIHPGTYNDSVSCAAPAPPLRTANFDVNYTISRSGNVITVYINSVTQTTTYPMTSYWLNAAQPLSNIMGIYRRISGLDADTTFYSFNLYDPINWPDFDLTVNWPDDTQCQDSQIMQGL